MKSKKSQKQKSKSKSLIKKQKKKQEYISLKKIQNEQRQKIIESLVEHNKKESNLIEQLESAKNLGKKRKKSPNKLLSPLKKETNNDTINEANNNNINEYISDSESESFSVKESSNIPPKQTTTIQEEKVPTQEEILAKIHAQRERERMLEELEELKDIVFDETAFYKPPEKNLILVNRTPSIIESRKKLPIIQQEHEIMYAIDNSLVTVISGETGSGKSTQIPQFIYEKGYTNCIGQIAITQPRRVAARALATRLAEELNVKLGEEVGYQIRYEIQNVSNKTVIRFVTDGILLKELENDQLLLKYSVIIIDEAHERTINSDLLLGFISQILKIRYVLWKKGKKFTVNNEEKEVLPLRLVIMSATLRVEEFTESEIFLPNIKPRHVEVSTRQFKVTVLHSKKTKDNYIEEAYKLCLKIHSRLPDGNVLVFLTGKREILDLCRKLNDEFSGQNFLKKQSQAEETNKAGNQSKKEQNYNEEEKPEEEKIINEIEEDQKEQPQIEYKPVIVLPLYSSMTPEDQMKIYNEHGNKRMFVISTNVAETSLTIPNIRYVIDSGKVKRRIYKSGLSFSTFEIEWISQASASQRAGRAGRTCEGYCYRLYSNGLYVKMEKFNEPQISSSPLSQVVLTMKAMKVKNIQTFPFITKPNSFFLDKAVEHLTILGALESDMDENLLRINKINQILLKSEDNTENNYENDNDSTNITDIGMLMAKFPIEPKLAKMLIMANNFSIVEYIIIIVGFMSVENPFDFNSISYKDKVDAFKSLHIYNNTSDVISYLNLLILTFKNKQNILQINHRKYEEIKNLVSQLYSYCQKIFKVKLKDLNDLYFPSSEQNGLIMQILLCAFIDNIARKKVMYDEQGNELEEKVLKKKTIYECNENNIECKLHYLSLLNETLPEYVIYREIIKEQKSFLQCVSAIKPEWIYNIGGPLVKDTLSMNFKEPYYNKKNDTIYCFVNMIYGYKQWDIPNVAVEMRKTDNNYYRYLARFILDGELIEGLKEIKSKLNSNPNIITNKFSDMYLKVGKLIKELRDNAIDCREKLINKLKENKNYLKDVILLWYDDNKIKNKIKYEWPFLKNYK